MTTGVHDGRVRALDRQSLGENHLPGIGAGPDIDLLAGVRHRHRVGNRATGATVSAVGAV